LKKNIAEPSEPSALQSFAPSRLVHALLSFTERNDAPWDSTKILFVLMRVIPPTWGIVPVISKLDEKQANWPKVGARSAIGEQLAAAALNQVPGGKETLTSAGRRRMAAPKYLPIMHSNILMRQTITDLLHQPVQSESKARVGRDSVSPQTLPPIALLSTSADTANSA
jgi:hypothetical protein